MIRPFAPENLGHKVNYSTGSGMSIPESHCCPKTTSYHLTIYRNGCKTHKYSPKSKLNVPMRRVDSLEETLMLGGIGGRRRRGQPRHRAPSSPNHLTLKGPTSKDHHTGSQSLRTWILEGTNTSCLQSMTQNISLDVFRKKAYS